MRLRAGLAALLVASALRAATFTVTNTSDSGIGSLRQAILDANVVLGPDSTVFDIPGPGVHTTAVPSPCPRSPRTSPLTATRRDSYTRGQMAVFLTKTLTFLRH